MIENNDSPCRMAQLSILFSALCSCAALVVACEKMLFVLTLEGEPRQKICTWRHGWAGSLWPLSLRCSDDARRVFVGFRARAPTRARLRLDVTNDLVAMYAVKD